MVNSHIAETVHNHTLRNYYGYYSQHIRINNSKFTINYSGPVFWNALPEQLIIIIISINQFKRKLLITFWIYHLASVRIMYLSFIIIIKFVLFILIITCVLFLDLFR